MGFHRIPMHKIEFLQINVSAKFKDRSCLEEREFCAETHVGRSQRPLFWTLDHARSPQRVARGQDRSHSRLHVAHSTRTIGRGLHFQLTLFVPPSAEFTKWGNIFIRTSPVQIIIRTSPVHVFHTHICILIRTSPVQVLLLHLDSFALGYLPLDAFTLPLTLGYV